MLNLNCMLMDRYQHLVIPVYVKRHFQSEVHEVSLHTNINRRTFVINFDDREY